MRLKDSLWFHLTIKTVVDRDRCYRCYKL